MVMFMLIIQLLFYILCSIPLYLLAKKADHEMAWVAFIPIFNVLLMLHLARLSLWWMVPILITGMFDYLFFNIIYILLYSYIYFKFIEAYGKNGWLGLLLLIPIVGYIFMYYLALSNDVQYVQVVEN